MLLASPSKALAKEGCWFLVTGLDSLFELCVVMMLFVIGLELEPSLLWKLRTSILGLGGMQVLVTSVIITVIAVIIGVQWQGAVALGLTLSLSSTAIVLQTMNEKGLMKTHAGQSSFSVLLFTLFGHFFAIFDSSGSQSDFC